jgi:hypothetical protein
VRLVLAGHLHRSYARVARPDGESPLILQGGSATSTRLRGEPNAFNWVDIKPDGRISIDGMIWQHTSWQLGKRLEV